MQKLFEKYYKIFQLEGSQGYKDKAVMGGMRALATRWPSEARENAVSENLIPVVSSILNHYPDLDESDRRKALLEIGDCLSIPNIHSLPEFIPNEAPPSQTEHAKRTEPKQQLAAETRTPTAQPEEQVVRSRVNIRLREIASKPMGDATYGLDVPVDVIRGVGEKQASHLVKMGVRQIKDLLYLFPRRYDDYSKLKTINHLVYGEEITILAKVISVEAFKTKKGKRLVEAVVSDTTGALRLLWMNQDWHLRYLKKDLFISISGKIDTYLGHPVIWYPDYEPIDRQQLHTNRIVPVYPLTAKITQRWLRRTQFNTVRYWAPRVSDFLNEDIRSKAKVLNTTDALLQIHFPENQEALEAAQRRFAFDEIFLLQVGILQQKRMWQQLQGHAYHVTDEWLDERIKALPYELTASQRKAVDEIRTDLSQEHPMNRLLQGDVGSGKTIVAVLGMAMVIESGAQTAIMAPTGILAEQHYQTIRSLLTVENPKQAAYLEGGQVRLLTGDTSQADRAEIHAGLESGYIKVLIGTHALIEDPVKFQNLQMVVVDEQHRFGVAQRAALRAKGDNPHLLVMTATPIPRSLQFTIFGDLDVSIMDELPAGRMPIQTFVVYPTERERVYRKIRSEVEHGNQVFIIYPLVEAGENEEIKAAVDEQVRLQQEIFPDLKIGLVHGRLRPAEKDQVMLAFREKAFDILVSTSVVEVGVDIPNATVMVIEGANHFGLSQLHQFRGRVGRGDAQSYCFLIPDNDNAVENRRLQVMTETNDGFKLAEIDLQERGPGDFLGTRQAGALNLQVASLADINLIKEAREIAEEILAEDPDLTDGEYLTLKDALEVFWPQTDGAGDVS
ncbi:MAG: ATP-dependent DNA helicase RecG [Chloroflexi bacterium]|jgi:ATP-dependent DNA helicase RecG|nr:ATP-dependent DNA helicase RecG [Chloroflexota bacterium]